MSTTIRGIRDLDGKFSRMIEIKERCDDIGISYPLELVSYFGKHDAAQSAGYLRQEMEEIDISDAMVELGIKEGTEHYQVDLKRLSGEVKAIRFTNSWQEAPEGRVEETMIAARDLEKP